jgi:hypothetical protein
LGYEASVDVRSAIELVHDVTCDGVWSSSRLVADHVMRMEVD